jgi:hypothetical protein
MSRYAKQPHVEFGHILDFRVSLGIHKASVATQAKCPFLGELWFELTEAVSHQKLEPTSHTLISLSLKPSKPNFSTYLVQANVSNDL